MKSLNKKQLKNSLVKKAVSVLSVYATYHTVFPSFAHAVCPICTVAVAGGLGVSRYFGIDDSLLGVWAGGLVVSVSLWTADWLSKRSWKFLEKSNNNINTVASLIFWTLLTYVPLYSTNIIGHPFNTTLRAIRDSIGYIRSKGVEIVLAKDLLE